MVEQAELWSWQGRVDLAPRGKARHRVKVRTTRWAPKVVMVADRGTKAFEAQLYAMLLSHAPPEPMAGPVRVDLLAAFARPSGGHMEHRGQRFKLPSGLTWKTSTPDADNVRKAVLDALSPPSRKSTAPRLGQPRGRGWWHDDAQVVAGDTLTVFHEAGDRPHLVLAVRQLPWAVSPGVLLPWAGTVALVQDTGVP